MKIFEEQNDMKNTSETMDVQGEGKIDAFQAVFYNSGNRFLHHLEQSGAIKQDYQSYQDTLRALQELKTFHYNIGFAGEQSSGKSTVINSLIEYPLMSTCNLTTTCVSTRLIYGENIRIIVNDDDTSERVLDIDCKKLTPAHIAKLKEYVCAVMAVSVIENIQYFTDKNIFDDRNIHVEDLKYFNDKDPKHIAVLVLVLLTVYVGQNNKKMKENEQKANAKRKEVLKFFGFPIKTINYSVQILWDHELLKSGMIITDLPGLGALAGDMEVNGNTLKGHDRITIEAIQSSDAMVFLVDYTVKDVGTAALKKMLSSAKLKDVVNKGDRIISVMNKADLLKGAAQKETSINKILSVLESANVTKSADEILLYSAIAGEYQYQEIPFEQTIYCRTNYEKVYADILEDYERADDKEVHVKTISKMKKRMEKSYSNSGIEYLKEFFRVSYIKEGKYNHAIAAVLAMRRLLLDTISPLKVLASNYATMSFLAKDVIEEISGNLEDAASKPINDAIAQTEKISIDVDILSDVIDSMPDIYVRTFTGALEEYKEENIKIIREFDLQFLGWGNSARIDNTRSSNYRVYQKLLNKCNEFPVDIAAVNKKYTKVLGHITKEIEKIYRNSMDILDQLQKDFPVKFNAALAPFEQQCKDDPAILQSLETFKETLVNYVEKQMNVIAGNMVASQDELIEAGNQTAAAIIEFNDVIIDKYTKSVTSGIYDKIHTGRFFKSKEYLLIDGNDGLKNVFINLTLSKKDKEYIEEEVDQIGNREIRNNLQYWIEQAKDRVKTPFHELYGQLMRLMKDTTKALKEMADGNSDAHQKTIDMLESINKASKAFRGEVQESFDLALEEAKDDVLKQCKGNIFYDILD